MADTVPKVEEVTVEDVSSDEEMPGLEQASAGAQEQEGQGPKSKQSRSEKKARKVVQRLGLKPVPGVMRVSVRKGKSVLFVVNNPDVYKSGGDTTFVIFGEAKIEQDAANSALSQQSLADFNLGEDGDVPDLVPAENAESAPATEGEGEDGDVNPEHIQLVIDQTSCSRSQAIAALKETKGDVVNAIMKLTVS